MPSPDPHDRTDLRLMAGEVETVTIPIASLAPGGSPRTAGEDPGHLRLLAETEARLPPIIVHRPTMRVIDGRHRVAVAMTRGEKTIEARFFDGSEADAFVLAVRSNMAHGLPLSPRDRTAAAGRIIRTHPGWSDRVIASVTGISARTVAELRARSGGEAARGRARLGRDGRVRPIDGDRGRLAAAELIAAQPELSLRQVAQRAGISPETARDVRKRLDRGQSPLPDRTRETASRPDDRGGAPSRPAPLNRPGADDRGGAGIGRTGSRGSGGRPPDRVGRAASVPSDRSMLMQRLYSDPQVRDSEGGRALLRLLFAHLAEGGSWERMVESVPAHRSGTVALLAMECSQIWTEFADRVEDGREIA